jgi:hypothetical protein
MPVSSEAYGDLLVLHATKFFGVFSLCPTKAVHYAGREDQGKV